MNSLKSFVNQIETFGKPIKECKYENSTAAYYRIDTVTTAVVYYGKNRKPYRASFFYH